MKRALISVSNKEGILEFAQGLHELGIEIISTGGTARQLQNAGLPIIQISEITHFPEMMDGRVKTLHPNVHGGILARRSNPEDLQQLAAHGITPIDLVVVNLYPFSETIAKGNVDLDEALENIDIGGPSMIRAAAKNFKDVAIVVDQADYASILAEMRQNGNALSFATKMRLAGKAFAHTASYDAVIDKYFIEKVHTVNQTVAESGTDFSINSSFNSGTDSSINYSTNSTVESTGRTEVSSFPERVNIRLEKVMDCRYGENPHQNAAFYREVGAPLYNSVSTAKQLYGKELSFNNLNDVNGALELVREFSEPAAVVIKHANPCGAAVAATLAEAYDKAYNVDPVSAYGSIVAVNRPIDVATAQIMTSGKKFIEVILAPSYEADALALLKERWKNIRILEVGEIVHYDRLPEDLPLWDIKQIRGGYLVQELDNEDLREEDLQVATEKMPSSEQLHDLRFAWKIVKHVKSNAIVLAKDGVAIGVGAGQMSRVDSMQIAISKAGELAQGAVVASDAYFPFRDSIDEAARVGVAAIIQPGGSIRDEEVIKACNEHSLAMLFTGMRHFKH